MQICGLGNGRTVACSCEASAVRPSPVQRVNAAEMQFVLPQQNHSSWCTAISAGGNEPLRKLLSRWEKTFRTYTKVFVHQQWPWGRAGPSVLGQGQIPAFYNTAF